MPRDSGCRNHAVECRSQISGGHLPTEAIYDQLNCSDGDGLGELGMLLNCGLGGTNQCLWIDLAGDRAVQSYVEIAGLSG